MKILKDIESTTVIALDIETVRLAENFGDAPENIQSAWEYKNKQDGEVPTFEKLTELWEKNASLYPEFSKVCAVSLVYLYKDGSLRCKSYASEDEHLLLSKLGEDLVMFGSNTKNYRLIGHASKFFDYPFLCKRYIINYIDIPPILDESDCKPWDMRLLDTNELWRSFGTGAGSSLQALCCALEIEVSKVDLVGDAVGRAYFKGELARISEYCDLDTIATFNVLRRFKKEKPFTFKEVHYVNRGEILKPDPMIFKIMETRKITADQKKKLSAKAKTLKPEEVETMKQLLIAALSKKNAEIRKEDADFIKNL